MGPDEVIARFYARLCSRTEPRASTLIICVWFSLLAPTAPLVAQTVPCVEITLPADFPAAAEWRTQIGLETGTSRATEHAGAACATLEVVDEREAGLSIVVSYQNRTTFSPLALDDVPEVHRARVAALVAQSLLRALVEVPPVLAPEEPARAAPQAFYDVELDRVPASPRPDRALQLLVGARAFLGHLPPLARAELSAHWTMGRAPLRYAAGLVGDVTTAKAEPGRLIAGSFGVRVGIAFPLLARPRARLWLGPYAEANALIASARETGSGPITRRVHVGAASADVRLSVELGKQRQARTVLSFDIGGVVHPVRLHAADDTLVTYAGVCASVGLGVQTGL